MASRASCLTGAVAVLLATASAADADRPASTMIKDAAGTNVGVARLTDTPNGTIVSIDFAGMPPGTHAVHIHEVGKCEPPFTSAGGHFNPTRKEHGFANENGYHAGDLPNVVIAADGSAKVEIFVPKVRLTQGPVRLFDADGAALVVHAHADDHRTDPGGNAGDRIACGVLKPLEGVKAEDIEVSPP